VVHLDIQSPTQSAKALHIDLLQTVRMSDAAASVTPVQMDPATIIDLWYQLEDAVGKVQLYFAALW